jgi:aspartyl protease family protein
MNSKFLFALICGALFVVAGMRDGPPDEQVAHADNPSVQDQPAEPSIESTFTDADILSPTGNDELILDRQSDGHFYALAQIGGSEIRLMVDTGASAIALTGDDAVAIGLSWDEEELRKVGRGASGNVYGKPVIIDQLQVGDLIVDNVQAAIIPRGLDVSLLGQSFLSKVGTVKISGDKMTLK